MRSDYSAPPEWQTDPAQVKRIAVLCDNQLFLFAPDGTAITSLRLGDPAAELADVVEAAINVHCGALWLVPLDPEPTAYDRAPIAFWPEQARRVLDQPHDTFTAHELSGRNGQLVGLICQGHTRGQRAPMGVYPAWLDTWGTALHLAGLPILPAARAGAFARGVLEAARRLDMQLRFSPSYTGLQMLRQELATHHYPIPPLSEEMADLVRAHRPSYLQWCVAAPEDAIRHGAYVYKYDRNSSFVASAGEVPCGDPEPTESYQPGRAGFYRISVPLKPHYGGLHMGDVPGPFRYGTGAGRWPLFPSDEETWAWEPQIRLALKQGYPLTVREGYYWPRDRRHDLFRAWRERIWRSRAAADEPLARTVIKQVGVATIGRLGQRQGHAVMRLSEARRQGLRVRSHEVDEHGELTGMGEVLAALGRADLYQPHWWAHIIANATERLQVALYAHQAYQVVAAYVDAVYCLSPWPTEDIAPEQLGKWKLERRTWLTAEQWQELNALASDPAREGAYSWVARLAQFARQAGGQGGEPFDGFTEEEESEESTEG